MALKYLDAKKMIKNVARINKLFVVKQNRFNKPILKLREAIDKRFSWQNCFSNNQSEMGTRPKILQSK